jgi:hypothetical protein
VYAFRHSDDLQAQGGAVSAAVAEQGLWPRFLTHYRKLDIAHDLAEDIGTPRWWRGMGVLATGIACALSFWPGHARLEAAMAMPMDAASTDEWRSQTLRPLALGAEIGQRMAPTHAVTPIAAVPERPSISLVATLAQGICWGGCWSGQASARRMARGRCR